jgi:hypothetical protein
MFGERRCSSEIAGAHSGAAFGCSGGRRSRSADQQKPSASGVFLTPQNVSGAADLDDARLGAFMLLELDVQHALLELCADAFGID